MTATPADIVVRRCTVRVVRHGGWSWGPQPQRLVDQVLAALPSLIAERLGDLAPDGAPDVEITEPVRIVVSLTLADLLAGRFDPLRHAAMAAEPLPEPSPASGSARPMAPIRPSGTPLLEQTPPILARAQDVTLAQFLGGLAGARRTRPVPGAAAGGHPGGLVPVARRLPGRRNGDDSPGDGNPGPCARSSGRHELSGHRRACPVAWGGRLPGDRPVPATPGRHQRHRGAGQPPNRIRAAPARRSGGRVPRPPGSGRPGISQLAVSARWRHVSRRRQRGHRLRRGGGHHRARDLGTGRCRPSACRLRASRGHRRGYRLRAAVPAAGPCSPRPATSPALAPALQPVGLESQTAAFATALAYTVLGPLERAWRRQPEDLAAAAAFAGLAAPVPGRP